MIISRTPFRVSFFGGGTDYPAWAKDNGGAVLATSIDKYCYISVRTLPPFFEHKHRIIYSKIENVGSVDEIQHPSAREVIRWSGLEQGLEIHHDGDLPARSGLGSSSSFTVGMINAVNALKGELTSKEELAKEAIYLEQDVMKEAVGSQDQIQAAFGGFNRIDFHTDGAFSVTPVILNQEKAEWLQDHLMLFFTGVSRYSTDIAKTKIENFNKRENELNAIRQMVDEALDILSNHSSSIVEFGKLLHKTWMTKRKLSDKVSTDHIDEIYDSARSAGAIGGKVLGAGGGGFMLFFVEPPNQNRVREKLKSLIEVPFSFENSGSRIVLYQPDGL